MVSFKTRLLECIDQSVLDRDSSTLYEAIQFGALELRKFRKVNFFPFLDQGISTHIMDYGVDWPMLSVLISSNTSLAQIASECKEQLGIG